MSDEITLEREGDSLVLRGQVTIGGLFNDQVVTKPKQDIRFRLINDGDEAELIDYIDTDKTLPSNTLLRVTNGFCDHTFGEITGKDGNPLHLYLETKPDDSWDGSFLVLFEGNYKNRGVVSKTDERPWEEAYQRLCGNDTDNNNEETTVTELSSAPPEFTLPEETEPPPADPPPPVDPTGTPENPDDPASPVTDPDDPAFPVTNPDDPAFPVTNPDDPAFPVTNPEEAAPAETDTAETDVVEQKTSESPREGETVDIWTEEGVIRFTNPMTIHAVDAEKGAYREEQVSQLEVHTWRALNDSDSIDPYLASEDRWINDDKVITINGGVCKKQENGAILIEGSAEDYVSVGIYDRRESHETHDGVCVEYQGSLDRTWGTDGQSASPMLFAGGMLLAALLGALISLIFSAPRRKKKKNSSIGVIREVPQNTEKKPAFEKSEQKTEMHAAAKAPAQNEPLKLSFGKLQQIGKRSSQQDSFGLFGVNEGLFAVVADGMGGLKDGDRVSQKIVQTIESDCRSMSLDQLSDNLMGIVSHANDEVSRMLGPDEIYKSGSTLVAVVAEPHQFRWISVGDSRIYLYRAGRLLQLNREHIFEADLLMRAVNHQISFQDAKSNPKRKSVSSFIGMGDLKYVDEMLRPIRSLQGDRILICSDGIFNTIKEPRIEAVLSNYPDPKQAAIMLETIVTQANNPHQDNFTAIILSYD